MKKLGIIVLAILLAGCQKGNEGPTGPQGPNGSGAPGEITATFETGLYPDSGYPGPGNPLSTSGCYPHWLDASNPNTAPGTGEIRVASGATINTLALGLVRFNLSYGVPANAILDSCTLELTTKTTSSLSSGSFVVGRIKFWLLRETPNGIRVVPGTMFKRVTAGTVVQIQFQSRQELITLPRPWTRPPYLKPKSTVTRFFLAGTFRFPSQPSGSTRRKAATTAFCFPLSRRSPPPERLFPFGTTPEAISRNQKWSSIITFRNNSERVFNETEIRIIHRLFIRSHGRGLGSNADTLARRDAWPPQKG